MAPGVTNYTALRGLASPSVVSLQLTNFMINLSSTTRITYQPAISNTQFGSVIAQDQFEFHSADGFQVDFLLSRNSFTIVKYEACQFNEFVSYCIPLALILPVFSPFIHSIGTIASVFNVIILVASLYGSVVAVFAVLVSTLEDKLGINSVNGAPLGEKDVVTYYSTRTEKLEQEVEELKENQQAMQQMKQKFDALEQAVRELKGGKAPLTESVAEPMSMASTLIANNNPLFEKQFAAVSLPVSDTAAASEVELVDLGSLPAPALPQAVAAPPLVSRPPPPPPSRAASVSLAVAEPSAVAATIKQSASVESPVVAAVRARPAPISRRMQSIIVSNGSSPSGGIGSAGGATGSRGGGAAAAAAAMATSPARAHVRDW